MNFENINDEHLSEEFQILQQLCSVEQLSYAERILSAPSSMLFCNLKKNRYPDVVAIEKNRVHLNPLSGKQGSDYINANFVIDEQQTFISTQAPLPSTVDDFWRMLFESRSSVVVMLTKLVEKNITKADRYWPEEVGSNNCLNLENFKVVLLAPAQCVGTSIYLRKIQLQHLVTGETRAIFHIMYTGWPDFGVPESPDEILQLISLTDRCQAFSVSNGYVGPIVVHCSAGCGRTGTFISIYQILSKLAQGHPTSVMEVVLKLRKQRHGSVQTVAQYTFIYRAIQLIISKRKEQHLVSLLRTSQYLEVPLHYEIQVN